MSTDFFSDLPPEKKETDFFSDLSPETDFFSDLPQISIKPKGKMTPKGMDYGYGLRQDGSQKGVGYFGELKTPDNKAMTELSVGVNLEGKETEIPTLVPTLTGDEVDYLIRGGEPNKSIIDKAVDHARLRTSQGKNPFAEEGEQQEAPEKSSFWDRLGQAFAYQAQSNSPISVDKGEAEGEPEPTYDVNEKLKEMGIRSDVSPEKRVFEYLTGESPSQKAFQSAIKKKPTELILAPLRGLLSAMEATFGESKIKTPRGDRIFPPNASEAWREKATQGLSEEEINALNEYEFISTVVPNLIKGSIPKKLTALEKYRDITKPKSPPNPIQQKIEKIQRVLESPTATKNEQVAAQRAIDRLTGKYDVETGLEKIAKSKGITKDNVLQRVWDRVKKWSKDTFGKELTPTNITPEESLKFIEYVEQEEKAIPVKKPVEKVKPTNIKDVKPTEVQKPIDIEKPKTVKEPVVKPTEPKVISKPKAIEPSIRSQLPELQTDFSKEQLQKQKDYLLNKVDELIKNPVEGDKVTVKVPGDGLFKINNNKENLIEFKYRVNKLWPTKPFKEEFTGKPTKALRVRTQKVRDKAELKAKPDYEKTFIEYAKSQIPKTTRKIRSGKLSISPREFQIQMQDEYEGVIRKSYNEGKITLETANEDAKEIIKDFIREKAIAEKPKKAIKEQLSIERPKVKEKPKYKPRKSEYTIPPRRSEMIDILRKAFSDPIRIGRISKTTATLPSGIKVRVRPLGLHKGWSKVTRLLKANDVPTATHEIGHNLHFYLYGGTPTNQRELFNNVKKALTPYTEELKKYHSHDDPLLEGFANFVSEYIINRDEAFRKAPKFLEKFEADLKSKNPDMLKALDVVGSMYNEWLNASPMGRLEAHIAREGKESIIEKLRNLDTDLTAQKYVTDWIDDLFPLKKMVADLFNVSVHDVENIKSDLNVYRLARLLKGTVGKSEVFMKHETFDINTLKKTGEGFFDIISPLNKREVEELEAYLIARRAIEKKRQGIETGIDLKDAKSVVKDLADKYTPYAERIDKYQEHLLQYYKKSGMLSDESYRMMKEANKNYIPYYRDMGKKALGRASKNLQANPVLKRMKGSSRDILPPFSSIIINTYKLIEIAEKNRAGQTLVKLATSKFGGGSFVEEIPRPIKLVAKVKKPEIIGGMRKKLGAFSALLEEDNTDLLDNISEILPDDLKIFRAASFVTDPNIITVWYGGKPKFFQVSDEIDKIWKTGFSPVVNNTIVKILRYPAKTLRAGAVLNPIFIAKNIIRDTWGTLVFTKYKTNLIDVLGGLMHSIKKDNLYVEWLKSGGAMSTMQSLDRRSIEKHLDKMSKHPPIYNATAWLRIAGEISEEANRLGEFTKGLKVEGSTRIGKEIAAFAARDLSIDFAKFGNMTKLMNSITPFFNAHLQGLEKFYRAASSPNDRPELLARMLRWVVLPTILSFLLTRKNEDYDELSEQEKGQNIILPYGDTFLKFPITIEPAILCHDLTMRLLKAVNKKDPKAFEGYFGNIISMVLPNLIPQFAKPFIEAYANKDYFTETRIIPQNKLGLLPEFQSKKTTSLSARLIGKGLSYIAPYKGPAPAIIDHFINSWGGGLGRMLVNTLDWTLEKAGLGDKIEKPEEGMLQRLGFNAFVVRYPRASTKSVEEFYDIYERNQVRLNTLKYSEKEKDKDSYVKVLGMGKLLQLHFAYEKMQMCQKAANEIYKHPKLTAEQKRAGLDRLYKQQTAFCRAFVKKYKEKIK